MVRREAQQPDAVGRAAWGGSGCCRDGMATAISTEAATIYYTVAMSSGSPRSIRFDERVSDRLTAFVASHPGWSGSSAANRFVDEALRMEDHPGVIFRDGPAGRRAVLIGGPDVRELIRAVKSARASEPDLDADEVVSLVSTNTGVPARLVDTAIRYWAAYPAEIDSWIDEVETFEEQAAQAWERRQDLLAR
jgi:hypothetical protein